MWMGDARAFPAGTLITTASDAVAALISANTPAPRTALTLPITSDDAPSETVETTTPSSPAAPATFDASALNEPSTRTTRVASASASVHAAASTRVAAAGSAATGLETRSGTRSVNL